MVHTFPLFLINFEEKCKRKIVINTIGSKFLIHLALIGDRSHPKPYFQTLNTPVGAGPILVEPYYDTSTEWVTENGGRVWFQFLGSTFKLETNIGHL